MLSFHLVFRHFITMIFTIVGWEMLKWHWRNRSWIWGQHRNKIGRRWKFNTVPFPDEEK